MSRNGLTFVAIGLLLLGSGCRNRCGSQCGGGLFAGSSTIAAPATYSLNIPSVANNQPYYVPGQTNLGNGSATLNPNAVAPNPPLNQAQLNGWRPSDDNSGANNANSGASVLSTPTTFANNGLGVPNGYRTASATALPGSGTSYTDSRNYQTTRVDERMDQSRLPATDASSVRAPAKNFPTGEVPRLAQANQFNDPRYPATFNSAASAGMPVTANGQLVYQGNPIVGNNGIVAGPVYRGQPMVGSFGYRAMPYANSNSAVLAQSTTTYDASNGGQLGWRDREINSDSFR